MLLGKCGTFPSFTYIYGGQGQTSYWLQMESADPAHREGGVLSVLPLCLQLLTQLIEMSHSVLFTDSLDMAVPLIGYHVCCSLYRLSQ